MSDIDVRYMVTDVDAAVSYYTGLLDFSLDVNPGGGFAVVSKGALKLYLNEPGAGRAGQALPDGRVPEPGGWNRIQLEVEVEDLDATVSRLKEAGAQFRNEIVTGRGGKRVLLDDPSGNPIELFQPA